MFTLPTFSLRANWLVLFLVTQTWVTSALSQGNSDARVYLVFNYNEGSPYHTRTGDSIPIADSQRIVGPRVFTLPGCANRVTHVHAINSSHLGFGRPWDDNGHAYLPCETGKGRMPCEFLDSSGNLDTARVLSNADSAASQYAYYRFSQDVIDGTVTHFQIDYEFGVPHDSLWGWYYQTQSKFDNPNLPDRYLKAITDSLELSREQYNAIHRLHWKRFAEKLKEINPNYRMGFYALPAMNRLGPTHRDKVRYQEVGSIMPDTVFNHIMDNYLGLNNIEILYHQSYVNLKSKGYFGDKLADVAPYTLANALSNKQKFHSDSRTWNKPFAVGFWLPFWGWDSLYTQKMDVFEATLDSLASHGIRKIWLSSGTWKTDGSLTELLAQLNTANVPLDTFWADIERACRNTILKNTCTQFSPPQKTNAQETLPESEHSEGLVLRLRPNPFRDQTTISWRSENDGPTLLQVFDARGNLVRTLVDTYYEAGSYTKTFYTSGLPPGMYYCLLRCGEQQHTRTMVIAE